MSNPKKSDLFNLKLKMSQREKEREKEGEREGENIIMLCM